MYKLEFLVRQIDERIVAIDYKLFKNGVVLEEATDHSCSTEPLKHFNHAVSRARGIISQKLKRKYGVVKLECVCLNPKEQFASKRELIQRAFAKRFADKMADSEQETLFSEPEPLERKSSTERLYEVVEVGGVWTIKKHETKWFTADEAKTQLFAKVVNGD